VCWPLLQGSTIRKRQTYEEFLTKVSIFKGTSGLLFILFKTFNCFANIYRQECFYGSLKIISIVLQIEDIIV